MKCLDNFRKFWKFPKCSSNSYVPPAVKAPLTPKKNKRFNTLLHLPAFATFPKFSVALKEREAETAITTLLGVEWTIGRTGTVNPTGIIEPVVLDAKLKSIEYDNRDITGYIVPYHAHSDFIQLGAELGIIGYLLILINLISVLIKQKKINENVLKIAGILYLISVLIPILPSGSFFTSYTASLFWLNYSFLLRLEKNN